MRILLAAATVSLALAQEAVPPLDEVLARVAQTQEQAREQRKDWVYQQSQLLKMIRGNGKVAREERRQYTIMPKPEGFDKQLVHFEGKYENHGKTAAYEEPGYTYKELDIDGELINEMSDEMTNDKDTRDGVGHDLFPLTKKEQEKYRFQLKGTDTYRGRRVIRLVFEPRPHQRDEDDASWKGEALIDAEEFQPVLITTKLAHGIPVAVRILLGTNLHGLGFSVSYEKFAEGVWFPVSYGGEFEVRAVFFYKRKISVSLRNSDFRRTDVTTKVAYQMEGK